VAVEQGLGPGALSWMEYDEAALSAAVQRFLAAHRVPYAPPIFDANGKYLLSDPSKAERVGKLLARAVAHAKDDEYFVLMVDELARLRVPVVCMAENDVISPLLDRLESLRRARRRP